MKPIESCSQHCLIEGSNMQITKKKKILVNQMVNYADHVSVTFMGDHKRLISKAATDVR